MAGRTAFAAVLLWCLSVPAQGLPGESETDGTSLFMQVVPSRKYDPTQFRVECVNLNMDGETGYKDVGLEVSFIPDSTPSAGRTLAYLDRLSTERKIRIRPYEEGNPFFVPSSGGESLNIMKSSGTCKDAEGVFRCKAVYQPTGEASFNVSFTKARLPACLPGAVAAMERDKMVCRVDPNLVAELYSLEVSYIIMNERRVLAYINGFLNDAQVSLTSNATAEGQIFPSQPARSRLNLTNLPLPSEGTPARKSIYTCKAVYLGRNASAGIVESFADHEGPFVYFGNNTGMKNMDVKENSGCNSIAIMKKLNIILLLFGVGEIIGLNV